MKKQMYAIVNGKLKRTQPFRLRCGKGVFMSDKGEFLSCRKCGDRYNKDTFGKSVVEAHAGI